MPPWPRGLLIRGPRGLLIHGPVALIRAPVARIRAPIAFIRAPLMDYSKEMHGLHQGDARHQGDAWHCAPMQLRPTADVVKGHHTDVVRKRVADAVKTNPRLE